MSPRVGIDAHMVGAQETGNETYVLNLLRSLPRVDAEQQFEYRAVTPAPHELSKRLGADGDLAAVRVRPASSLVRIPFSMPLVARRDRLDILHVTYVAPPFSPCPTVVTVHDITFRLYPQHFPARVRLVLSALVPYSMRRAARVIALSNSTKQDIVSQYGIPEDKIAVTSAAAGPEFGRVKDRDLVARAMARYGIQQSFVLAVGNLQPRKNIRRLVEAYAQLPDGVRRRTQLVIAGQALWQHSSIVEAVSARGLQTHVVFTGYVPDEDLVLLYNAATLFAYPSLYEGFGLPVLEAMACGTPVVTSSVSSLPEVAGDAAILVDPTDVGAIASALSAILTNPDLARRLSERGLRRAGTFSWEQTARQTLGVYREIVRRND